MSYEGSGPIAGMPSVGIFIRDHNTYLPRTYKFRRKTWKIYGYFQKPRSASGIVNWNRHLCLLVLIAAQPLVDPHVYWHLRKILKHQTEVDNNPCWLVQHDYFNMIIYIWIKRGVLFFYRLYILVWPIIGGLRQKSWQLFFFLKIPVRFENVTHTEDRTRC